MSNALRYDALLVRDLARELARRYAGARLDALRLDRDRLRCALLVRPYRRGTAEPPCLLWQLHPHAGHLTPIEPAATTGARVPLASSTIAGVSAPPDERILHIDLDAGAAAAGAPRRIVIELVTNQWNVIVVSGEDRIVAVLRERVTRDRVLRAGAAYAPPAGMRRAWAEDAPEQAAWAGLLRAAPPGARLRALLRDVAWTSPLNAAAILGRADFDDGDDALERARLRFSDIVHERPRTAVLLAAAGVAQPYSVRLGPDDVAQPTLLDAFTAAAAAASALPPAPDLAERALAAVAQRIEHVQSRLERLEQERAGAAQEADSLRAQADLLLGQLHAVERGAAEALLDDWQGGHVRVALDPALSPADNARQLYDTARRRGRAAARVPALLEAGSAELARLHTLVARIRAGAATDAELQRLAARRSAGRARGDVASLPYRTYRTSGGLEVRVGRGARANDELTFRCSHPNDVWLHARDVAGAHVILRWTRADQNPSARDIHEAAVLAALHSRARTSGTVAVDWTRRKYVRKPRKAAPGLVLPERVRTVFVEPDEQVEERLRIAEPD